MKQQSKGQGSITYDKKHNSYRAYYVTPAGQRPSKRFKTKKEAAEWLAQQAAAVSTNSFTEPSKVTLGSWLLTWLNDYKKASVSIRTFERYTEFAEKCAPLAENKLQLINAPQIQQLYTDLAKTLGANTINKIHKLLKAAMKKAVMVGLLPKNIMDAVEPPSFDRQKEIVTFSKEEVAKLLTTAKIYSKGRYYPLILLAITSGMRLGEILALRFCDINPKKQEVSITRNLQLTKEQGIVINPPKTKAGRRIITLPAEVITTIYNLHHDRTVLALDDLIFITRTGNPCDPHNIERAWRALVKASGVEYRNFHVLRHTHCTDLLADGVPIVEVARRVGHSRISHTLELYGHAIPRYDKEIAAKVGNLYLVK